mgnify:CR=1 FL=1|tara:strand:+ start:10214 stop:13357 length:3144 start_codon:yes stop_codon:yes gene_type:complete
MATTNVDKIATNFVLKVYETKALAEEGDELNALYVFNNGIDGDTADELVSNGSQFISGVTTATTSNKLVHAGATPAYFGSRLVGKIVKNTTDNTEAAITAVDSSTQLSLDADIMASGESYHIEYPGAFFTFQKYYYRLESTDPVLGFIIDWDDGEDNSPEKANRQTVKLDSPQTYAVVTHTYTTHGIHYPMIRTINPQGFYSKWYLPFDALAAGLNSIEPQTLSALQNDFSKISLDSQTKPRIPAFAPANTPPVGVLKLDRNIVYSGIDNSAFKNITNSLAYCYVERSGGTELTGFSDSLEVVWEDDDGNIQKDLLAAHSDASDIAAAHSIGTEGSVYVNRILSVKIVKLKENISASTIGADERVRIHAKATGYVAGSSAAPNTDPIVTMVSLGNPYISLDRPGFSVNIDGSQSQTLCSNVDIGNYIFDTGKLIGTATDGSAGLGYGPGMPEQVSDIIGSSLGTNSYTQSDSSLQVHYTLAPNSAALGAGSGNVIDSTTKRIYDEERLVRLQVIDSSANTRQDASRTFGAGVDSGADTAEAVDGSETAIDVDDGTKFTVGDVISRSATVDKTTHEQMYVSNVSSNTLTVVRQYNDSVADSDIGNNADLFILTDNGQLGDNCTHSFIEHWEPSGYSDNIVRPPSLRSRALLMYATTIDDSGQGALTWKTVDEGYRYNTRVQTEGSSNTGETGLIFGGAVDADSGETNGVELSAEVMGATTVKSPQNYLLMCKDEKFNKVHLRMNNSFVGTAESDECISNAVWDPSREKTKLVLWYTAKTSPTATTYAWKPIAFEDGTICRTYDAGDTGNNSLRSSGSIVFNMPNDWVKIKSSDLAWDNANKPLSDEDGPGGTDDPAAKWTDAMYGLLLGISVHNESSLAKYKCVSVQSYNNTHSQPITIVDPHHKSLNDIGVSQSLSYKRAGTYVKVSDRIGRTELRKIGAQGGSIRFGGVELAGNYSTQKKLINIYQREGTPVYYDIQRASTSGEYIRFFGVITSISEDYPVGMQHPKFGIEMLITHVCEYDSNGAWIGGGLMSLGGERIDVTGFSP